MIPSDINQVSLRVLADEVRVAVKSPRVLAVALGVSGTHVYRALREPGKHPGAFEQIARVLGWEPDPKVDGLYRRIER